LTGTQRGPQSKSREAGRASRVAGSSRSRVCCSQAARGKATNYMIPITLVVVEEGPSEQAWRAGSKGKAGKDARHGRFCRSCPSC
jgi:hypothetical protein